MTDSDLSRNSDSASRTPNVHLWEMLWFRDLAALLMGILLLAVAYGLREVLQPVLLALFLAYLINPAILSLEKRTGKSRAHVINVIAGSLLVMGGLLAWLLVPSAVSQSVNLIRKLPTYVQRLTEESGVSSSSLVAMTRERSVELLDDPLRKIGSLSQGFLAGVGFLGQICGSAVTLIVSISLVPVYLFFFSHSWPDIVAWTHPFLPARRRARILEIVLQMDLAVGGYFRTRLFIAGIMAAMYASGWAWFGVPYWLLLGIIGGMLGIVPYASGLAWIAAMVLRYLELKQGIEGWSFLQDVVLWPTLVYGVVQVSDDWILTPRFQGRQLDMPVVVIILSVILGGAFLGLFGMLLAVPFTACVKIYWREVLRERLLAYADRH